ncbi:hypothetical protein HNQ57_002600 [Zhongshania antarctica]|uniref:Uncharacterized protein n=1 Tax=Zhongshania antarctica TaxID=641702 RepID=A0A840R7K4_9GAMM|nr:hypothetical protein [Zhongshania antarctica]MBB5188321.1 hypothetical protein [Zhongshania antarctica]
MLTQAQKEELRRFAEFIVEQQNWHLLPWSDALSGAYPLRPTAEEVEMEFDQLSQKAVRIMSGGSLAYEYDNIDDHARMILLESAKTFRLYSQQD